MKQISGKDFGRTIEKNGWRLLRVSGSTVRLSIPILGHQSLKAGLLRHFLKLGDIAEDNL